MCEVKCSNLPKHVVQLDLAAELRLELTSLLHFVAVGTELASRCFAASRNSHARTNAMWSGRKYLENSIIDERKHKLSIKLPENSLKILDLTKIQTDQELPLRTPAMVHSDTWTDIVIQAYYWFEIRVVSTRSCTILWSKTCYKNWYEAHTLGLQKSQEVMSKEFMESVKFEEYEEFNEISEEIKERSRIGQG